MLHGLRRKWLNKYVHIALFPLNGAPSVAPISRCDSSWEPSLSQTNQSRGESPQPDWFHKKEFGHCVKQKKKKVFYTAPFLVTLFLPSWQVHWYRPRLLHLQSCALSAQLVRCLSGTMWWKQVSVKMWAQQSLIQAWVWHRLFHLERFRPTVSAWSKSCSFLSSADEYISVIKWTATKQKLNNIRRSWQHHQGCGDMYNSLFSNPVGHISEGTRVEID